MRKRVVHLKVGVNRIAGPLPAPYQQYHEWVAGTACGEEVSTISVTRSPERITCEECLRVAH